MEGARFLESGEREPSRKQTAGAVIYSNPAEGGQGHTQTYSPLPHRSAPLSSQPLQKSRDKASGLLAAEQSGKAKERMRSGNRSPSHPASLSSLIVREAPAPNFEAFSFIGRLLCSSTMIHFFIEFTNPGGSSSEF
ncbi:hypothetical protein CapIbe_003041 [Capra ibex]